MTGQFGATATSDAVAGAIELTSRGDSDAFVFRLNGEGTFVWA
jgi:hypothetical protein